MFVYLKQRMRRTVQKDRNAEDDNKAELNENKEIQVKYNLCDDTALFRPYLTKIWKRKS